MIDLHIHTKYSDGKLQVNEILQRAKEQNITVISICDHNVLGAYMELSKMDITKYNMKIITGIEFDFVHNHKDFHMLGYNFDWRKMNESSLIDKRTEEEIIKDEREKLNFLKNSLWILLHIGDIIRYFYFLYF